MIQPNEQQKKNQNVIEAGRGAYRMDIQVNGNPHSKQPYRDLWDKGWRLERRKEEAGRSPRENRTPRENSRPPFKREPGMHTFQKPQFQKRRPVQNVQNIQQTKPAPQELKPVITNGLIDRFNRRHQTKA